MKPKNKIIRLRERNPLLPSNQIAKAVGVSRQWVSYVLNRAGLVTAAPRQKAISTCMKCGCNHTTKKRFCSKDCYYEYYNIKVECSFCHVKFRRKRYIIDRGVRDGYTNIYCSRRCYYRGQKELGNNGYRNKQRLN